MNFLKKGPEIKLSEIKVPEPVKDVYYDLKERHLLPLAAILLIAIVVVPFALGKSTEKQETPSAAGGATATTQSTAGDESGELVAKSDPGLRDYKRRLEHLKSKNPFRQQYRKGEPGESGSGGTSTSTVESSGESETSTESGGGGETVTEYTQHHLIYYSTAIDVKVTTGGAQSSKAGGTEASTIASGDEGKHKTQERHNLPELTMLPSRETPAIIFMGATKDGKKALMLVSSAVSSIFGDATCVLGSSTCELLAMEEGLPETFVYGANNRTFKIEVTKIQLVESDKVNKAPLGKPHKHAEG